MIPLKPDNINLESTLFYNRNNNNAIDQANITAYVNAGPSDSVINVFTELKEDDEVATNVYTLRKFSNATDKAADRYISRKTIEFTHVSDEGESQSFSLISQTGSKRNELHEYVPFLFEHYRGCIRYS